MNRRQFLLSASALPFSGCKFSLEQGMTNPCKSPSALASYPSIQFDAAIVRNAWTGIDPTQVWDTHTHLFGDGDSGTGVWLHPEMAEGKTLQGKVQRAGYLNAGCVIDRDGQRDKSMLARLQSCAAALPPGAKVMAFAFDYAHNESGERVLEHSTFYVPDSYARDAARRMPERFEWVASIHPYRKDAIDALAQAKAEGARAVKWLPAAQGMNPSSPFCKPFFRALAAARLPLIIHAGKELAVKGPDTQTFGNPLRLRAALDEGVRVIVAHCASLGNDTDLDQGEHGPEVDAFALFARLMDASQYQQNLFADLSAVAQMNRMDTLPTLLRRSDWHPRLLNGSDYPLPGVMPLYSLNRIVEANMLAAAYVPTLRLLREHNPLSFDFVLKRALALGQNRFSHSVFHTRRWFV
jgi:uncharacterized protein